MVTVAFSVATSPSAIGSPAGEISRITSGETGSLKVSFSVAGVLHHRAVGRLGLHQRGARPRRQPRRYTRSDGHGGGTRAHGASGLRNSFSPGAGSG